MCLRRTWVLSRYDGLLLENISHIPIKRPFWRATRLRGQIFHKVYGCDCENIGVPASWYAEINVTDRSIHHLSSKSHNWLTDSDSTQFTHRRCQWELCCSLNGRLAFRMQGEYHENCEGKVHTNSFTVNSARIAEQHTEVKQLVIRIQYRRQNQI